MCLNEAERRQLLYLQGFYLEVKRLMEVLEKKLKAKPLTLKHAGALERKERVNA